MYGSILSILLMGVVPVWGLQDNPASFTADLGVARPVSTASLLQLSALDRMLTASGVIIVDLESGQTVYEKNPAIARPMASLTKLMTALIILEHHDLNEVVTVPADIDDVFGTVAGLPANEPYTVDTLLSALLIESANDAAVTLAQFHSGSMDVFADEMNARAKALGLKDTSYQNPTGLDAPTQQSSPRDLSWLAMYVMKHPEIAKRMSTRTMDIYSVTGKKLTLTHTHQLLTTQDKEVLAGKTGTTDAAGQCLLSIVEANGRRYIAVLLHSEDRYADMRRVLTLLTN